MIVYVVKSDITYVEGCDTPWPCTEVLAGFARKEDAIDLCKELSHLCINSFSGGTIEKLKKGNGYLVQKVNVEGRDMTIKLSFSERELLL